MAEIEEEHVSLNDVIIENLQQTSEILSEETNDSDDAQVEWERDSKALEDSETKLIVEFNQVMSNTYLLPGYVLGVSSAVSGLLSSEPHLCWLMANIVVIVFIFLVALWVAVWFSYQNLKGLQERAHLLVKERTRLHRSSLTLMDSLKVKITTTSPVLKKFENYKSKNFDLTQVQHYDKFLLLITICGLLYALMLLVAGYYVLCVSQSKDCPCTPCTPTTTCLRSVIPLEPVPEHLPFTPCAPSLRLYQDM